MKAFYKQFGKAHTDYHMIDQHPITKKFGIGYGIDTVTKTSYKIAGYVFDTFEEAERMLYKHRPGSRRFA